MRVTGLKLKNFCAFEDYELKLGKKLTRVRGGNGTGKTSLIEAFRVFLDGGTDASLVRTGQDAAEAVLVLEDGQEFRKRIPAGGGTATLSAKSADGVPVRSGVQGLLRSLMDAFGCNPISFLTAKKKERFDLLLATLPVAVSADEMVAASGSEKARGYATATDGLKAIDGVRDQIYSNRRDINAEAANCAALVKSLEGSIPPETAADVDGELEKAERLVKAAREALDKTLQNIAAAAEDSKTKLRQEAKNRIDEIQSRLAMAIEDASVEAGRQREIAAEEAESVIEPAQAEVSRLRQLRGEIVRVQSLRQQLDTARKRHQEFEIRSKAATAALERLDALKLKKLAEINIAGLETRGDELYVNDVPWDRVNTAERIRVACQIAAKRLEGKGVKFLFIDGAEALDPETLELFETYLAEQGIQALYSMVEHNRDALGLHVEAE